MKRPAHLQPTDGTPACFTAAEFADRTVKLIDGAPYVPGTKASIIL